MWDHFSGDLGKTAQSVGNTDEAVGIDRGHVTRYIPSVPNHCGGLIRLIEVAFHDRGTLDEQHARLIESKILQSLQIDDLGHDAGERAAYRTRLAALANG